VENMSALGWHLAENGWNRNESFLYRCEEAFTLTVDSVLTPFKNCQ
jgi:hypothetical protein